MTGYTITPRPKERDVLIDHGPDRPLIFVARREGVEGSDAEALALAERIARLEALERVAEAARDVVRMEGYEAGRRVVRHPGNVLADALAALDAVEVRRG